MIHRAAAAQFGELSIWRVEEWSGPAAPPRLLLPDLDVALLDAESGWLAPDHYAPELNRLIVSIHSWVLKTPNLTVLIDTCVGAGKTRTHPATAEFNDWSSHYIQRLAAAGFDPDDIDVVMCTHLHVDHCGWNTRLENGSWVPTFANARYLFGEKEISLWREAGGEPGGLHPDREVYSDSVLPILDAGRAELIAGEYEIGDSIRIEPAPGHTPGHIVLRAGRDRQALFSGDVLHHVLQVLDPRLNSCFCSDAEEARRTRRRILSEAAEAGTTLFPAHFGAPHFGRVRSKGDAFEFLPGR